MQTIGERLEEARKRKGISIREAAEITKIRSDYLQKFESNTFELDLPPLYIRGFMRTYARYLDLDPDRIIAEFDSAISSEGRAPRRESREVYGRVEFGESGGGPTPAAARPAVDQAMLLKYGLLGGGALVAIVIIILLINVLTSRSTGKTPPTTQPQAQAESSQAVQPADTTQTLTFTGIASSRLKIVQESDNKVLFNQSLAGGETRSFRKIGTLLVTVEDRSKIRMEINGRATDIPQFANGNYGRFRLE